MRFLSVTAPDSATPVFSRRAGALFVGNELRKKALFARRGSAPVSKAALAETSLFLPGRAAFLLEFRILHDMLSRKANENDEFRTRKNECRRLASAAFGRRVPRHVRRTPPARRLQTLNFKNGASKIRTARPSQNIE